MTYEGIVNPLDLKEIFVTYLAGSMEIFFLLAVLGFGYLAARFRMPNQIFLILMGLFVILMANEYTFFFAISIFIIGLFSFYSISKLVT